MAYNNNYGYAQNGYTQYLDNSGKPLTGGSIETFIAGTTTPVLTFKDFNGGRNPHKITLDENGGATIILRQDTVYKFIIRDKNGDIFKTIDNIISSGNATVVNKESVLIAYYNTTSYTEIDDAVNAGKVVLLRIHPLPSTRQYALISSAEGGQAFVFSRVTETKLYKYTCTGQGWSQSSSDLGGGGGGSAGVEIVQYNVSSYSDILTAHNNGKLVILIYPSGSASLTATLSRVDSSAIEFRYVNDSGRISTFEVNQYDVWKTSTHTYGLPTASATVLGGIKVGGGLEIIDGVLQIEGYERNLEYGEEQNVEFLELEALEPSLRVFTEEGHIERLELEALEPSLKIFQGD